MVFSESDTHWMQRAIEMAHRAQEYGEVPVGAVLVSNNELIAESWNQPISQNDPSAHAEIMTLRLAGEVLKNYRLVNTTLYVTLEPCAMCAGALMHARIQKLIFAAQDPKTGAVCSHLNLLDSPVSNFKIQYHHGLMLHESRKLLQDFFKNRRS